MPFVEITVVVGFGAVLLKKSCCLHSLLKKSCCLHSHQSEVGVAIGLDGL